MRKHYPCLIVAVLCLFGVGTPAFAQNSAQDSAQNDTRSSGMSQEQSDRMMLKRLSRQVKRIDRDTAKLMTQAMEEARRSGGSANPETKARLLSLRDERDRIFSRMLILSMRYGWEIPEINETTVEETSGDPSEREVFGSIDVLVRRRFATEAKRIVDRVSLPVVSLASTGK